MHWETLNNKGYQRAAGAPVQEPSSPASSQPAQAQAPTSGTGSAGGDTHLAEIVKNTSLLKDLALLKDILGVFKTA